MTAEKFEASDPRAAYTLDYLGTLYQQRKMDDEALRVYEQALKGFDKALGDKSDESRASAQRLAESYEAVEQWKKAEPLRRRLVDKLRAEAKADPLAMAQDLNDLAYCLDAQKNWDEAMGLYDEVLRLRETVLGAEATEVAETLNNQGRVHLLRGDLKAAEALLRRALSIDQKALGLDHGVVADDRRRLAAVLKKAGKDSEAEEQETLAAAVDAANAKHGGKAGPQPSPKPVPRPGAE
jgi:tetratricopeptide (TPR) repeat protein